MIRIFSGYLLFFSCMSERKSINKYRPADWDPSQEKKKKRQKINLGQNVRLMLPFSMKCLNCDEFMANRRKFNARKQFTGEDYLGIKIIKFTFRCSKCFSQCSFVTDPKNGDFECIEGCKKNYERPKQIKINETVEEMINRLEKEALEEAKQKEKEKYGNKVTGIEELEKRMVQQQKEREMYDEIELLQEKAQAKRKIKDFSSMLCLEEIDEKGDENEAQLAFNKTKNEETTITTKVGDLMQTLLDNKKNQADTKANIPNKGLQLGYDSDSD